MSAMIMAAAWFLTLAIPFVGAAITSDFAAVDTSLGFCFFAGGVAVNRAAFCEALHAEFSTKGLNDLTAKKENIERHCSDDLSRRRDAEPEGCITPSEGDRLRAWRKLLNIDPVQAQKEEASLGPPEKLVVALSGLLLLCCAFICPCFRTKPRNVAEQPVLVNSAKSENLDSSFESTARSQKSTGISLSRGTSAGSIPLDLSMIVKATHHFSESHKIGGGGFGTVYKATLPDGHIVAVKRARKEHFAALRGQFSNEVELLSKIDHRCLVKLVDFIDEGGEKIIITEYVPNGSLREHLDGHRGKILSFRDRLEIAIDIAHGLTYLHSYAERTIIHRDIKSSNILLTEDLRAKVADFGLASAAEEEQTHISTKVRGTAGYLDPEYQQTLHLSTKSDVFSFGILLLEILSGRRPLDLTRPPAERVNVKWAFRKFGEGNLKEIMDPLLEEEVDREVLRRILSLGFRCAANTQANRPAMRDIVAELWSIRRAYTLTAPQTMTE
ncbi:calmodulin-binding receptor-like cytoplasmic kinase 3 [Wolffia australiana]